MSKTILFNPAMVRAIRAGQKTQTRREVKNPEFAIAGCDVAGLLDQPSVLAAYCPYGKPGDRLRVKESAWLWCEIVPNGRTENDNPKFRYVPLEGAPIHYADEHPQKPTYTVDHPKTGNRWGWRFKVGRFLPSFAIRTVLEITKVRVERLQDISERDAVAEGLIQLPATGRYVINKGDQYLGMASSSAKEVFSWLWDSINKNWDQNPWVWVIEFKVIK